MIAKKWSLQQYSKFLEAVPDAMVLVDGGGSIVLINHQAQALFGYAADELSGRGVEILVPPELREAHAAHRADFKRSPHKRPMGGKLALEALRKDGSRLPVEVSLSPIDTGDEIVVLAAIRDVSERRRMDGEKRRLDARLQQSQKLESLGVLAGGIAHDFNNLLTSILGNAGLALRDLVPESGARDSLLQIERTAERAAELVRQLLAYSGRSSFLIQPLDLSRLAMEMLDMLQPVISKNAVLRHDFFTGLPAVNGDVTQIRQVIMNLITNASDAIGDKSGIITLRTGMLEVDGDYLESTQLYQELPHGNYVYLEVCDTGLGMDDETRARIFDPFFTTKSTGRGLGLAAVLGIVKAHSGTIKIYSEVGRGTTFKVLFPCADIGVLAPEQADMPAQDWRGSGRILVVDDEESIRVLLDGLLGKTGFEVLLARDGREAAEIFAARRDEIDLVLLDLIMPNQGGEDTFRELRRLRRDVPVLLMSGYSEDEVTSLFSGKGIAGFVQKPFRVDQLLGTLRRCLEDSGAGGAGGKEETP